MLRSVKPNKSSSKQQKQKLSKVTVAKKTITKTTKRKYATTPPKSVIPDFPGEATEINLVTSSIPGPKSKQLLKRYSEITEAGTIHFFADYEKSQGNYIVDADGNTMLDLFMSISSVPLGHNHPRVVKAMTDPKNIPVLVNRPSLGNLPSMDWVDRVENSLLKLAPKKMKQVTLMNSGSEANESAMKQAMMLFQGKKRNGAQPTKEDIDSCLQNQEPGSPQLAVLSFTNAFHGRAFGSGSATRSKWIHKGDFNAFHYWPAAQFPRNKYPLNAPENAAHNAAEEAASLKQVEDFFIEHKKGPHPIAAVIVEPIQAEGGDNHASADFFRKLQQITKKHGASLIVDEVQTGGGPTGRIWHHESWDLPTPPDYVTFSKKMLTGGFYYSDENRIDKPYRIFNTWMSAPQPVVQLEAVAETIEKDNLMAGVQQTGEYLMENLNRMQNDFPQHVANVRGVGTFIAFDVANPAKRDKLINDLKDKKGVEIGGCGTSAIRLRPALTFQPKHAEKFINALHDVIQEDLKQ